MTRESKCIPTGLPVVLGFVAVTLLSTPSVAQAQEVVLTACYVPEVGVVYMIKAEGLPEACTEETHVEFSWNMEGPAGPQGPAGGEASSQVWSGPCLAFQDPRSGGGTLNGGNFIDSRFTLSDPPGVTLWITEAATPEFMDFDNDYFLVEGSLSVTCGGSGQSYAVHVIF